MTANYLVVTEPAPSTTSYIRSGRGGAGNTFRASATSTSTRVNSTSKPTNTSTSSSSRRFFSGIGGAGNIHRASERPAPSLDDEVRRLATREENAFGRGHCGIGGAGNVYRRTAAAAASRDEGRNSFNSESSRSKLWSQMTGKA